MSEKRPVTGSLVLYKIRPARVALMGEKIDIELEGGKGKRVRDKDIQLLHPGPMASLGELGDPEGSVDEAWELLAGEVTHLQELAELAFGDFTPSTAWAAWKLVEEGLYFEGSPDSIRARSREQVQGDIAAREAKAAEEQAWSDFLARLEQKRPNEEDRARLAEVERLALGETERSRILAELGHQEKPENAHRMLIQVGYWDEEFNIHPKRQGMPGSDPLLEVPELPGEPRLDLTHLEAFAIDDEGSEDPDDAISLEGERIWVHVADVSALVTPDSALDQEARSRAANLYLPEGIVHMLPPDVTRQLGLGLHPTSPALSIGFSLDEQGHLENVEIALSRIRVSRHTYAEIDNRLSEKPFAELQRLCERFRARRLDAGAAQIDLPEASVRVVDGEVRIRPLERLESREMVTNAMLMAGEAVARYALEREIPLPFASQPPPDVQARPEGLAAMYAYRRQMKPSRLKTLEEPHFGLGLDVYTRATSPLRRYLDLVTHQQLRAHLRGEALLATGDISERIGASDPGSAAIRRAERLSNNHWKLVYLKRHPEWRGEGVVVVMEENKATLLIPELAMEARIRIRRDLPLNSSVQLAIREVDLTGQIARFRVLD